MANVSAVNHFIHRAHCSSTSPSCLPLSSSPDPVRVSAASEPSAAVSCQNILRLRLWENKQAIVRNNAVTIIIIIYNDITTVSLPFDDSVSMLVGSSRNVASLKVNQTTYDNTEDPFMESWLNTEWKRDVHWCQRVTCVPGEDDDHQIFYFWICTLIYFTAITC